MACRLVSGKPLSEPILAYFQPDPKEHISVNFRSKIQNISFKEMWLKESSVKWCLFVSASMCEKYVNTMACLCGFFHIQTFSGDLTFNKVWWTIVGVMRKYSVKTSQMSWLFVSPSHQQPWYSPCHIMKTDGTIKMTSLWAPWHLESPASRLFAQPLVQAHYIENTKVPRHWPLWGEPPVTAGSPSQKASNADFFHLMTSSWCRKWSKWRCILFKKWYKTPQIYMFMLPVNNPTHRDYTRCMITSSHRKAVHITGPLWGESRAHQCITCKKSQ